MSNENRRTFICLTNIPTPYRLHFFRMLSDELERRGWNFEAWFMAKSEPGRHWQFKKDDFNFRHRFFWGISFGLAGAVFHFNPGVPPSLIGHMPDILLVAGGWGLPTNILTTALAKAFSSSTVLFWSESHLRSSKRRDWFTEKLRSLLLGLYDGFAVPGTSAAEYVKHYLPDRPLYNLPNTVDESVFRDQVLRLRSRKEEIRNDLRVGKERRILFLPARLTREKGILSFLTAIRSLPQSVTQRFTLFLAGDGPLRGEIGLWTKQHPCIDLRLMGHIDGSELLKAYAVADSFILPSLSDPNPLSVIEALWAGLPLILSDRVGNRSEALTVGENGLLFDPRCGDAVCGALQKWTDLSERELESQGRASTVIAERSFRTEKVVNDFLDQVLTKEDVLPKSRGS